MRSFTSSDGLTLAFRDEGTGVPVLCLAGLTRNSSDFDDLAHQIGSEARLIRLDYRGRGASDFDPTYQNYTVPVEARDALELLDYLGIPKAVIVGTSRGGLISMILAASAKDRLLGVVLNDIGPEIDPVGLEQIMSYLGRAPSAKTYEDAALGFESFYAERFKNVPQERWEVCARRWLKEDEDGLALTYDPKLRDAIEESAAQPAPDLWPFFDALEGVPLALIRGANSDLLSEETTAEMQRRRPDMSFANVPDRGHVPFLDENQSLAVIRTLLLKIN